MAMRTNAIMHFHCAECGSILELVYPNDAAKPKQPDIYGRGDISPTPEPTGAEVCYVQPISVRPCRACIEKYTGPSQRLMNALKEVRDGQ